MNALVDTGICLSYFQVRVTSSSRSQLRMHVLPTENFIADEELLQIYSNMIHNTKRSVTRTMDKVLKVTMEMGSFGCTSLKANCSPCYSSVVVSL